MKSTPIVAVCLEGLDCVSVVREHIVGPITNSRSDAAGTIRGDFGMSTQSNIIHASETSAAAMDEVPRFFTDDELFDYDRLLDNCIYAPDER
jgi:nucleoside-diphosphate kinase